MPESRGRRALRTGLLVVGLLCLVSFFSTTYTKTVTFEEGRQEQVLVTVGIPSSPWFRYEKSPQGRHSTIDFLSWSTLLGMAGVVCVYGYARWSG